MAEWTKDDSDAALAEGWDIFSDDGRFRLLKLDEPELLPALGYTEAKFGDDTDAWVHVRKLATEGSELHVRALAFLADRDPAEADAIREWQEGTP